MGRRSPRRMWHVAAALVPLPLIGLGYASIPGNQIAFRMELMLSGNGSAQALTRAADASEAPQPLPRAALSLFRTEGKGPRADQYLAVKTTSYADKQFVSASLAGADRTGLNGQAFGNQKTDRLNSPVSEVALRGTLDRGASIYMDFSTNPVQFQRASGVGSAALSAQTIAYHPSAEGLSFKSKGESQAEFEERERRCLATAIYFEARGEPVRGQIAVGQVILNRVRSPQFPQTICGVVYQGQLAPGCQFSFACDGHTDMPRLDSHWALAQNLARQITSGQVWLPEVGYSTYYHADYVRPGWVDAMNKIDSIGRHIFYKKRNEQPYVVQASAAPATIAANTGAPANATVALASSSLIDGSIAATPAIDLGLTPSE
jgi:spore germination cell wall hydrolase CwlJ-like protein